MIELKNVTFQYADAERGRMRREPSCVKGQMRSADGTFPAAAKTTLTCLRERSCAPPIIREVSPARFASMGRDIRKMKSWVIGQLVGSVFQDPKSQFFSSIDERRGGLCP